MRNGKIKTIVDDSSGVFTSAFNGAIFISDALFDRAGQGRGSKVRAANGGNRGESTSISIAIVAKIAPQKHINNEGRSKRKSSRSIMITKGTNRHQVYMQERRNKCRHGKMLVLSGGSKHMFIFMQCC